MEEKTANLLVSYENYSIYFSEEDMVYLVVNEQLNFIEETYEILHEAWNHMANSAMAWMQIEELRKAQEAEEGKVNLALIDTGEEVH